jgi:hypothetical protein
MRIRRIVLLGVVVFFVGCDLPDRVSKLETEASRRDAAIEYDLQAKCSKEARVWVNENWKVDTNTMTVNFSNHYNKSLNKCFIGVESHSKTSKLTWVLKMEIWEVQDNVQYGEYGESGEDKNTASVFTCEVENQKCNSFTEFDALGKKYLVN